MKETIKNQRLQVTVSDLGAEMLSMKLDNFEYLWDKRNDHFQRTSPVMFPITGRFMDGYYLHHGEKYHMALNGIAMEKHFSMQKLNDTELVCTLEEDEETLKSYPFPFRLSITYRLDGCFLHVTYQITNKSDEKMPYSVGNHTAYAWPLIEGQDPDSYFLRFEKKETLTSFNPFGWTAPFLEKENIRPIFHDFYSKGTRSFVNPQSEWIEYTGACCDYVVRMYSKQFPFTANWTKPDLDASLVCLEPTLSISSHGPSLFDREGIHTLDAHETETVSYKLELYKKSEQN